MLDFMYDDTITLPDDQVDGSSKNIRHIIGLYRVADKYAVPSLEEWAIEEFSNEIYGWLQLAGRTEGAKAEFCSIVSEFYDLVGSDPQPQHPFVQALLDIAEHEDGSTVLNNTDGNNPLLVRASQEIADFGRDLFLHLIAMAEATEPNEDDEVSAKELCIAVVVKCPECEEIWSRVQRSDLKDDGYCQLCGEWVGNWKNAETFGAAERG
jgi:hypothetical protein